jgi:hypothetical protein
LANDGFLVIERITSDEELEWLRGVYEIAPRDAGHRYLDGIFDVETLRQHRATAARSAAPAGTLRHAHSGNVVLAERAPHFVAVVGAAGAETRKLVSSDLQRGNSPAETPVAPGSAWDVHKKFHALATWLAIRRRRYEQRCLCTYRSHRGDVKAHRHGGNDPAVHVLEFDEPADTSGAVPIPLKAGGMTFHTSHVPFRRRGTGRSGFRRAWGTAFQSEPILRDEPAPHQWWHDGKAARGAPTER